MISERRQRRAIIKAKIRDALREVNINPYRLATEYVKACNKLASDMLNDPSIEISNIKQLVEARLP